MYKEYPLTLPGGFVLPVCLVKEEWSAYTFSRSDLPEAQAETEMEQFASSYLREHMVAGKILQQEQTLEKQGDVYILDGKYTCDEMIGQERSEEIYHGYGKTD